MIRVVALISVICSLIFLPQESAFCEMSSGSQMEIQELRDKNKDLQEQLNLQRELLGRLGVQQKKDKEEILRITKNLLDEREEERILSKLFSPGGLENMIFHGYVDLEWKSEAFDKAQGGSRGHNFFDNHHFNLWFGYRMTDNLIAKSEIEIEHGGEEFSVEFATIEWKPFSSDRLALILGKILVPLGIENPVHASVRNKLISRPLPSVSIIPGTYGDIGLEARGWYPSFSDARVRYHFYIVNGLGDDDGDQIYGQDSVTRGRDNNGNKAVGTQIALLPMAGLELGGSVYFGKWDDQDRNKTTFLAAHLIYDINPVEIRAEHVLQKVEQAGGAGSRDATLQGFYIQGAYRFSGPQWSPVFNRLEFVTRYDWIENKDGVTDLKQGNIPKGESEGRLAVGLTFRPLNQLQLKVEYLHRENKGTGNDNGLALQAVANW